MGNCQELLPRLTNQPLNTPEDIMALCTTTKELHDCFNNLKTKYKDCESAAQIFEKTMSSMPKNIETCNQNAEKLNCTLQLQEKLKTCQPSSEEKAVLESTSEGDMKQQCGIISRSIICFEEAMMMAQSCQITDPTFMTSIQQQMAGMKTMESNCGRDLQMLRCSKQIQKTNVGCEDLLKTKEMLQKQSDATLKHKCMATKEHVECQERILHQAGHCNAAIDNYEDTVGDDLVPKAFADQLKLLQEERSACLAEIRKMECMEKKNKTMMMCGTSVSDLLTVDFTNVTIKDKCMNVSMALDCSHKVKQLTSICMMYNLTTLFGMDAKQMIDEYTEMCNFSAASYTRLSAFVPFVVTILHVLILALNNR